MKITPMPFQHEGAAHLANNYRGFLADEMGLGKTIQALMAVELRDLRRVGVVCPASVRDGWKKQIVRNGMDLSRFHVDSYNAAASQKYPAGPYDALILDEAHFLKTLDSQRTKAIFRNETGLARNCKFVWLLSGTPILNRPRELYPILTTCCRSALHGHDSWAAYTQRYCGAFFDGHGINTRGASRLEELAEGMKGFLLRRTKKEVLPQLPPKIISLVPFTLTQQEMAPIYEIEAGILDREAYLSSTHEDYAQLGDMAALDRAIGTAKAGWIADFVEEMLETVDKVVVFAWHRDVMHILDQKLGHHLPVTYKGGMTDEQKREAVSDFINDRRCNVFIGQMEAAGTGLDGLQEVCNNFVFAEISWVPGKMQQAMDRGHRIGQKANSVNIYIPHAEGTLESAKLQVNRGKQKTIDILLGEESGSWASCRKEAPAGGNNHRRLEDIGLIDPRKPDFMSDEDFKLFGGLL